MQFTLRRMFVCIALVGCGLAFRVNFPELFGQIAFAFLLLSPAMVVCLARLAISKHRRKTTLVLGLGLFLGVLLSPVIYSRNYSWAQVLADFVESVAMGVFAGSLIGVIVDLALVSTREHAG